MIRIALAALALAAILARAPLVTWARRRSVRYRPSRLLEAGLAVLACGVLGCTILAEAGSLRYDAALALAAFFILSGLAVALCGLAIELRRNLFE
jgi:hypothetical protein